MKWQLERKFNGMESYVDFGGALNTDEVPEGTVFLVTGKMVTGR